MHVQTLVVEWRERAKARCEWCRLGWELGRHGCHWEPVPEGTAAEDWESMSQNCKAFGLRQHANELEKALRDDSLYIPVGTSTVTVGSDGKVTYSSQS
jgi:hypothetical protein